MDSLAGFEVYDNLVEPYLNNYGVEVDTVSWRDQSIDWNSYDMVIIRSPWDYQDAPEAFLNTLQTIEKSSSNLENSLTLVHWNIDKIYLKQLHNDGVSVIPTKWQERLADMPLCTAKIKTYFEYFQTTEIILKPRISANADNTFWLKADQHIEIDKLNKAFADRDFMVQPFVPEVVNSGEHSLFYFNGNFSHAILKTPKRNDFRVQEEHGGQLQAITPSNELKNAAHKCMLAIQKQHAMPLYARLDLVEFDGEFRLMEAELIEPSLYFNMDDDAPKQFADAIMARLSKG